MFDFLDTASPLREDLSESPDGHLQDPPQLPMVPSAPPESAVQPTENQLFQPPEDQLPAYISPPLLQQQEQQQQMHGGVLDAPPAYDEVMRDDATTITTATATTEQQGKLNFASYIHLYCHFSYTNLYFGTLHAIRC